MNLDHKKTAVNFLQGITAGHIDEMYDLYIDSTGMHHNVFSSPGFAALKQAMKENHEKFPNKTLDVQHVLQDGDLVAVHSRLQLGPNEAVVMVVHLFRFAEGKIVELWDCGQVLPKDETSVS